MKRFLFNNSLIVIALLMMSIVSTSIAGTYYIAANGSDNNNGSESSPWKTVMNAWRKTGGGDVVLVRAGTYTEYEMWFTGSKGSQLWTLKAYPGEEARFTRAKFVIDADYVRIQGLTLDGNGSNSNIIVGDSRVPEHVEILDNLFTGSQSLSVLEFTCNNGLVQANTVRITGGSVSHAMYIKTGKNNIVRGNYVTGMSKYGIQIYDEDKWSFPAGIKNFIIEDNIVVSSKSRSGIVVSGGDGSQPPITVDGVVIRNNVIMNNAECGIYVAYEGQIRNIEMYNNTIYGNKQTGIEVDANNVDNITIMNNIFASNGSNVYINKVNVFKVSHNLYYNPAKVGTGANDDKPILNDPLFVDAAQSDFHLKENSPAIDAGVDVGITFTGKAPDLGAFEYGSKTATEKDKKSTKPTGIILHQNYPNPFNPSTEIRYDLASAVEVDVSIFDISGRWVKTLVHELQSAGLKTVSWDGRDKFSNFVSSGVYFCRLKAGEFSDANRMLLVR